MQRLSTTTPVPAATPKKRAIEPLEPENLLAWDVLLAMWDQVEVVGGFGVAIVGFRYEALRFVFDVMVPEHREREVFEKFLLLKPYAIEAMRRDGRDSKGSDDSAANSGRRKRRT
jgi:hypothetical protein